MDIQPITQYTGKVVPLFNDNIDTDQIIPKFILNELLKLVLDPLLLMNGVIYLMDQIIRILI